jgi:hypothetical protein
MFLKIMTDTGNVGGYFSPMGKTDTGHLAESRIRLFRRDRHYAGANTPLLRTRLKSRRLGLGSDLLPPETNQLIDSRHELKTPPQKHKINPTMSDIQHKTGNKTYQKEKKESRAL